MDNQTNKLEPASREPVESVTQEPINTETPKQELPVENEPIAQEPVTQEPINTEPAEVQPESELPEPEIPVIEPETSAPSNEYQQVLNQYAANTEPTNRESVEEAEVPTRSSEEQLQDLGVSPPPKTSSGFLKSLFNIALVVFIIVLIGIGLIYFKNQNQDQDQDNSSSFDTVKTVPTSAGTCFLNDVTYQVGQSFVTADGCNTCTCESQDIVSCTDKECVIPTSSATKSATSSSIPKIAPDKVTLNFYQDYIKAIDAGLEKNYKNSPYLTQKLIESINKTVDTNLKTVAAGGPGGIDPIIFGQETPDCEITTDKAIINNNFATVKLHLCYSGMVNNQPIINVTLVLVNNEWKIDSITPNK